MVRVFTEVSVPNRIPRSKHPPGSGLSPDGATRFSAAFARAGPLAILLLPSLVVPAALEAFQTSTGAAPSVRGTLTDEGSGIPLATGFVALYGPDGDQLLSVFTDEKGRYSLPAPGAGSYRVRAERFGYHPQEKGPFTLQATVELTVDFQLSPSPLLLDSILVSVRRQSQALRAGEQLVYGRLLDDGSGGAIPQGLVRVLGASGSAAATLTDDDGLFWLVIPSAGTYRLQAERLGYRGSTGPELYLMLGDTLGVDFYLSQEAILLNPIVVRATARPILDRYDLSGMEGFFRRYARFSQGGYGEFLTRDSLARYEQWTQSIGHVLTLTMMSVWEAHPFTESVMLRGGCPPAYYLNGFPMPPRYPMWSLTPDALEAVEVYLAPSLPAEFVVGFPCGVVSYWTRRSGFPGSDAPLWRKALVGFGIVGLGLVLMFGK